MIKIIDKYLSTLEESHGAPFPTDTRKALEASFLKVIACRNPEMRSQLLQELCVRIKNPLYCEKYISLITKEDGGTIENVRRSMIKIAKWGIGGSEEDLLAIKRCLLSLHVVLKDANSDLETTLIQMEHELDRCLLLTDKDKLHLLAQCTRLIMGKDRKSQPQELKRYTSIFIMFARVGYFSRGCPKLLSEDFTEEGVEEELKNLIQKKFFSIPKELIDNYVELSGSQRHPLALEQYASQAHMQDPKIKDALTLFVKSLCDGTYRQERYAAEKSPHLTALAEYHVEGESQSIWKKWKSLPSLSASSSGIKEPRAAGGAGGAADEEDKTISFSIREWMKEKLVEDNHAKGHLPTLVKLLRRGVLEEGTSLTPIEEKCRSLLIASSSEDTLRILNDLLNDLKKDKTLAALQWTRDVEDLITLLSSSSRAATMGTIITDDWQDLLLCGTEVLGSCQTIYGPNLNRGLLGYCMDGKTLMIANKNKSKKITSRALLKLLFKQEKDMKKPVLFLETIYPSPLPEEEQKAINALAMQAAKYLGVDLYSLNPDLVLEKDRTTLSSLGCPVPYEYEDGGAGLCNGDYNIGASLVMA